MVADVGRVFVAVPIPVDARMAIHERISRLSIPGRVAPPENWHLTLRFAGSIDETTYQRLLHGLAPLEDEPAFRVRLAGLGAFPRPSRATVVWLGVSAGSGELERLNAIAETAAIMAGLPEEERPFRPHFTLARVRPPEDITHLLDEKVETGWPVGSVVVYRSHLGRGGARYEALEELPLRR